MSEAVSDTKTRLATFILETFPNADIAPGSVLSELVVKMAATIQNPIKADIDGLSQANSVIAALDSPTDTYSELIDNIATNYSVARSEGNKSTGNLKVTLSSNDTLYLSEGLTFTQPVLKLQFMTTATYKVTTNPVDSTDIPLKQINKSSLYYFILPVTAAEVGSQYKLPDQLSLDLTNPTSIDGFVDAKVYGNFSAGLDKETDKELISRFKSGLTHKTLLSKDSILHKVSETFPNLRDLSLVTANDLEQTRAKQNVFGISTLGMVDVYVKTAYGLETTMLRLPATKISTGSWTMSLGPNDAAGFYKIISILPQDVSLTGSLDFTVTYDYDNTSYNTANVLNNKYEARFSKYQTANIALTFDETSIDDVSTAVDIGTVQYFDVLVSYQPNIKDIQDYLLDPDNRILCADYLVKAALPCFVTVNLKLVRKDSSKTFPVDLLKQDIFKYINSLKFGENLYASAIIDLCHNYDIKTVQLPVRLIGDIYSDHSSVLRITSNDMLAIPQKLNLGISDKTTIFVSNYFNQDVDPGINITDAIGIEVI